jgi:hypothetical protein
MTLELKVVLDIGVDGGVESMVLVAFKRASSAFDPQYRGKRLSIRE